MILTIAKDVLNGLQYLHRQGLAHRDLKVSKLAPAAKSNLLTALQRRIDMQCSSFPTL